MLTNIFNLGPNLSFFSGRLLFLYFIVFSGCGYRFEEPIFAPQNTTITIPYIECDHYGELTAEVTRQVVAKSGLRVISVGGDITLCVRLIDFREKNIGFRYDRNNKGQLTNNLIPSETRLSILAEITVLQSHTGNVVLGPDLIMASVEYDHQFYSNEGMVNVFSLGQLNDISLAKPLAYGPLYRLLAQKIADHIIHGW